VALLIDTTALIAVERSRGRDAAALGDVLPGDPDEIVAIAAVTASELLVGVHRAHTDAQRARREAFVEAMLVRIPVVPFDLLCARTHARLAVSLAKAGVSIGVHDLQIAATAADLPDSPYVAAGLKVGDKLMLIPDFAALKKVFYP